MRAMILAAGRGERMRPLTDTVPKPLLALCGKPLIEYHLEKLKQAGVKEVIINHAWLGHKLVEALGDGRRWNLSIKYSDEQSMALETAGGIAKALPLLGDSPFWVINGDIWTDYNFSLLPSQLARGQLAHLMLVANPQHNPGGDFAINGDLLQCEGADKLTFSGIGLYHPDLFTGIGSQPTPLAPLLKKAMALGKVGGGVLNASWTDVGTPARLIELQNELEGINENLG